MAVAAPLSGLRLLLLRTLAVVVAAAAVTLLAVVAAPTHGWMQLAWLLPALATCTVTLAIGARAGMRRAAGGVAVAWLVLVIIVAQAADDAVAPFRWAGQWAALGVALAATASLAVERRRLDRWVAE